MGPRRDILAADSGGLSTSPESYRPISVATLWAFFYLIVSSMGGASVVVLAEGSEEQNTALGELEPTSPDELASRAQMRLQMGKPDFVRVL